MLVGKLLGGLQASGGDGDDLVPGVLSVGGQRGHEVVADLSSACDAPLGRHFLEMCLGKIWFCQETSKCLCKSALVTIHMSAGNTKRRQWPIALKLS